ncbi:MAG TPA: hypothetical protein VK655_08925 [Solirubrobacteraceae bacterium]|nr:hypothetical protein [Solirubrobacteraceae bacterium]
MKLLDIPNAIAQARHHLAQFAQKSRLIERHPGRTGYGPLKERGLVISKYLSSTLPT